MVKICASSMILVFLLSAAPLAAEPKVKAEITKIAQHSLLVNFSWRVTVYSDKPWDGCDLKISFRDKSGKELFFIREVLTLKVGNNEYSGTDICEAATWKQIDKYVTTLDCLF